MATVMPFLKLYSATAFFFSASGSSFSLDMPAMPTNTMPTSETSTPTMEALAEGVPSRLPTLPARMGGTRVPAAEHSPQPIAKPRPTPRYRIIRPQVSPPTPHAAPHRQQ